MITLLAAGLLLAGCGGSSDTDASSSSTSDRKLVRLAHDAWREAKGRGLKLDDGPCLGIIEDDWVADVAHDPRTPVDDERANQCDEYHSGKAHHFVEVTPTGHVFSIDGEPYD